MDFELANMLVNELSLTPNNDKPAAKNNLKMKGSLEYNEADKKSAKLTVTAELTTPGHYNVSANFIFLFRFKTEVSGEEAEAAIKKARSEAQIFPYISAYLTNLIVSSGYPRPGIPLALL